MSVLVKLSQYMNCNHETQKEILKLWKNGKKVKKKFENIFNPLFIEEKRWIRFSQ